ncbi:MAG: fumarylacetoacetate hydrolase family protein [Actinomycetota bacterium]|nr:fumarylacetoacetate hydrolase family protein [Actinomycetota bacterium]
MKHSALAGELHEARLARTTVPTLTSRMPDLTREDAYSIQVAGIDHRRAEGETLVGGKLGFTSPAMQRAMGVDSPNYGWLTDAMLVHDRVVRLSDLIHPKVEPEIAFLLADDLGADATAEQVHAATAAVAPCLEVVDSRFHEFRFLAFDNIADNSSAGRVIMGDAAGATRIDLRKVGVVVSVDGEVMHTAAGAAALNDPAEAVAWMARTVAGRRRNLRAGDIVISGGLTAPVDLHAGMTVRVDIDRIGSASLRATED